MKYELGAVLECVVDNSIYFSRGDLVVITEYINFGHDRWPYVFVDLKGMKYRYSEFEIYSAFQVVQ